MILRVRSMRGRLWSLLGPTFTASSQGVPRSRRIECEVAHNVRARTLERDASSSGKYCRKSISMSDADKAIGTILSSGRLRRTSRVLSRSYGPRLARTVAFRPQAERTPNTHDMGLKGGSSGAHAAVQRQVSAPKPMVAVPARFISMCQPRSLLRLPPNYAFARCGSDPPQGAETAA